MSAAVSPAPVPLRDEGMRYWEGLIHECNEQISAINSALSNCGHDPEDRLEYSAGEDLHLRRFPYPSTTVKVSMVFEGWGPVLKIRITGLQRADFGFFPKELELPLASEGTGALVAIFDEGRSLTPRELASYLTQQFRRCFPRVSLPCPSAVFA